jgi:hypothetical protein
MQEASLSAGTIKRKEKNTETNNALKKTLALLLEVFQLLFRNIT